ncbi:FolC bifunctional protein [Sporormia fimetaria CBS 119925]|uniref:Folylpolyglutamate synthase n=1 Tax=Sporormia fimetaria CBS 119925 TaxID=1340428 RepID=A0A6A6VQ16_9PLEO|nr:FolC bifunctional protein [Sporormia fimetaria CBS 119925]
MANRDYGAAVAALNTLQSNFAIVDAIRKSGRGMNKQAIPEMIEWCRKIGYEPSDFDRLKPIHIAGTKGKGSTSAFVSSILSQYLPASSTSPPTPASPRGPSKIGLYTSPHLRCVRERIQINNTPISEPLFAKYFFEVWDRLEEAAKTANTSPETPTKPVYFRYLTLMAFHAYLSEGVDAAVIECGIGGEYDSTNVICRPTVTAVTSLGIDHTAMLGSTLPEIAWHKAGVFKEGVVAITAPQAEEALEVLKKRAEEKGARLRQVDVHPALASEEVKLGLAGHFQKVNASVAIAVAATHLRALGHDDIEDPLEVSNIQLPQEFVCGLEQVNWPGRCEIRRERGVAWYIDGGHTMESIEVTGRWFAEQIKTTGSETSDSPHRILIFNQQTRDANALVKGLYEALVTGMRSESGLKRIFGHVIFCTNKTYTSGYKPDLVSINTNQGEVDELSVQRALGKAWDEIDPSCTVSIHSSIEDAVQAARKQARVWQSEAGDGVGEGYEVPVLITGSLHLVGGAIDVLENKDIRLDSGS